MRYLIVCCDGTWNTPDQEDRGIPAPTNVVKLWNCLKDTAKHDDQEVEQLSYYHPGVGTEGGLSSKLTGGVYGRGISQNIMSAYEWLARHYEQSDDQVYLYGFSRGAYTVRSLAGMLSRCGLLKLRDLKPAEGWKRVRAAYEQGYRDGEDDWTDGEDWAFHYKAKAKGKVRFLGVWDTVGALGVPDDLAILNLFDVPRNWKFHDTKLSDLVHHARQAVAIDEMRASFSPTLWSHPNSNKVKQVWFAGVHGDVGGGNAASGLSDIALDWMIKESKSLKKHPLAFKEGMTDQIKPNPQGLLHNSLSGVFGKLRTQPRPIPEIKEHADHVHPSVVARQDSPPLTQSPYRPSRAAVVNQPTDALVYARDHWSETGIYLPAGKYQFTADGEWVDGGLSPCSPDGTKDGKLEIGEVAHLFGSALGGIERLLKKVGVADDGDLKMTRRHETIPWFKLTGVVAHELPEPSPDGTPRAYQFFAIGTRSKPVEIKKPGYLYAYPNDAWDFYDNNRGKVQLTVHRLS